MTEYIERGALLSKISRMIDYCEKDYKVNALTALFQVGDAIMDCNVADVAPVRRGKWIPISDGDGAECSECGEYFDTNGFTAFIKVYRYCPNCGTKMAGEE